MSQLKVNLHHIENLETRFKIIEDKATHERKQIVKVSFECESTPGKFVDVYAALSNGVYVDVFISSDQLRFDIPDKLDDMFTR